MKLKDIAQQAGVSISTVSRVLNDPYTNAASKEVQERIWAIVRANGYVPNEAARSLKQGTSAGAAPVKSLYCLIATSPEEQQDDPFYSRLISSIEHEALTCNYVLEYTFSAPDLENDSTLERLRGNKASGLIIIGRFNPALLLQINKYFKHTIYTGLNTINARCDQVICNGYDAARDAVQYFFNLGHRSIAFIGADDVRLAGYKDALQSLGLPLTRELVIDDIIPSMNGGYHSMIRLLERRSPCTAVFCANDTTSIGALRACKDRKLRVPEDISIMGMNNIETVQYVTPALSSIYVPLEEMGKMAAKMLIDRINGGHHLPMRIYFPHHIVERESCIARRQTG